VACTFDQHLLTAYLDGEIGLERALEVEAHLSSCPNGSAEAQDWKEVRATIQSAEFYYRPPAALEAKIRKLLPDRSRRQRTARIQHWTWAGGGAALASLALLLAFFISRPAGRSRSGKLWRATSVP
jgi:anti-sigma factor RsiW